MRSTRLAIQKQPTLGSTHRMRRSGTRHREWWRTRRKGLGKYRKCSPASTTAFLASASLPTHPCSFRYAAFNGRGSLLASGRWHWAGVPVIYTAESRALAALETLVHTRKDQIPTDYVLLEIEVDDNQVESIPESDLPLGWRDPEPQGSRNFGDAWVHSQRSVALVVPSIVIPQERNLLVNANHPQFNQVRVSPPQPFWWDHRLFH